MVTTKSLRAYMEDRHGKCQWEADGKMRNVTWGSKNTGNCEGKDVKVLIQEIKQT